MRGLRGTPMSGAAVPVTGQAGAGVRRRPRRAMALGSVVVAGALLAACGSSSTKNAGSPGTSAGGSTGSTAPSGGSSAKISGLFGAVPPSGTASTGGTITTGQLTGTTPTYIFPITPSNQGSVYNSYSFQDLMYLPLYASPTGEVPKYDTQISMANPPTYSNGNKTVSLTIKSGYKWSSGATVTAKDVVFFIDLVKAAVKENPSNFSNFTPGFFPDNVKSATASGETLTLKLDKAYNPGYFSGDQLDLLFAFPSQSWDVSSLGGAPVDYKTAAGAKAIYDFLSKQASQQSTFATSKIWSVVDGPAKLSAFTPSTSAFTMVPNPTYGGPVKMRYDALKFETFTSSTAEFNALKAGSIDIGAVDPTQVPQISQISSDYSVYGLPDFGFEAAFFNYKNPTGSWGKIISQLYIRQALAHLTDSAGYVKGIFKGAGGLSYGPVPAVPVSPYTPSNALTDPYPYSPSTAAALLKGHGWSVVPNGVDSCQKPGTAAGDCGAGIPKGAQLNINWFYTNSPPIAGLESQALASSAAQVGIKINVTAKTFNFLIQNYDNPSAKSNITKWDVNDFGGFTNSVYPSTNTIFNTPGTYNIGSYSDPKADSLIAASVFGGDPNAVKNEASYLTSQVPALFTPNPDLVFAVSKKIGGDPRGFLALTQYTVYPQFFYRSK